MRGREWGGGRLLSERNVSGRRRERDVEEEEAGGSVEKGEEKAGKLVAYLLIAAPDA